MTTSTVAITTARGRSHSKPPLNEKQIRRRNASQTAARGLVQRPNRSKIDHGDLPADQSSYLECALPFGASALSARQSDSILPGTEFAGLGRADRCRAGSSPGGDTGSGSQREHSGHGPLRRCLPSFGPRTDRLGRSGCRLPADRPLQGASGLRER
jgi:hypothetical protein